MKMIFRLQILSLFSFQCEFMAAPSGSFSLENGQLSEPDFSYLLVYIR